MISCRPQHLPREFSSILFVAVYLPPQINADTKITLNQLYKVISKQENAHPEATLLVVRHFNAGKLKSVFPMFYQHVTCATRWRKKPLDHLYSTYTKAFPHPPFGKSDHNSILLIPDYKQKLKQEVAVTSSIQKWSDDVDATLQDCFASTDCNMFRHSSNGIEEYTTSVIGFINKCIDDIVPIVTICTYPN
jgi:hypothetical protein